MLQLIDDRTPLAAAPGYSQAENDDALLDAYSSAVTRAVERAGPAVVHLQTKPSGTGSGFAFTTDGFLLTNHHVVERAKRIKAKLADGTTCDAEIVGMDPDTDLAVLRVPAAVPSADFGDSTR